MPRLVTLHGRDLSEAEVIYWLGLEVAGYITLSID